jgi:hypothetical protein
MVSARELGYKFEVVGTRSEILGQSIVQGTRHGQERWPASEYALVASKAQR